ncbi:hypothetical protein [Pseudactinotalea sp. Z1748]|uniref:hypothetical protein n=1 Tax=Pseudactinotalea sp. Z1748 TaxID=3413027 RepID=UPI003C7E4154
MRFARLRYAALLAGLLALVAAGCTSPAPDASPDEGITAAPVEDEDGSLPAPDAPSDEPPPTTTTTLVRDAVAAGRLDEPTGLMYRVWGQFNDPRLPQEYRGESASHDSAALNRAVRELDTLPAEVVEAVGPYLLRPTDPQSAFSHSPDGAGGGQGDGEGQNATGNQDDGEGPDGEAGAGGAEARWQQAALSWTEVNAPENNDTAGRQCPGDWETRASDQVPFRVWICADRGAGTVGAEEALDAVIGIVDDTVPEMIKPVPDGMGPPKPDRPGDDPHPDSDDKVDIYLLDVGWLGPERRGQAISIDRGAHGVAIATRPAGRTASSGFILIDAGILETDGTGPDSELARVVVHEVFHVLQFAHHDYLEDLWFIEGTATWAERYYLPGDFGDEHLRHLHIMQSEDDSLVAETRPDKPYATALWAMFMEQTAGSQSIFNTWQNLSGTGGAHEDVLAAIDAYVPVQTRFPDFVMRMVNANPAGNPIGTRFVHLDPNFPDDVLPPMPDHDLGEDALTIDHTGVPGLGYEHHIIYPDGPRDETVGVGVTVELEDEGIPTMEALVRDERGRYSRRTVRLTPDGNEFCVAGILMLIVSNSHTDPDAALSGEATVERIHDLHCDPPAGELLLEMEGQYDDPPTMLPVSSHAEVHWNGSLRVQLEEVDDGGMLPPRSLPGVEDDDLPAPRHGGGGTRYSGAGSEWSVHGSFRSERCSPHGGCAGHVVEQRFDAQETLGGAWGETENSGYLAAEVDGDGLHLHGQLPVTVTTVIHDPGQATVTRTDVEHWPLTCHTGRPFHYVTSRHDIYVPPDSRTTLTGYLSDEDRSVIDVECSRTWQPTAAGSSGTTTFTANGILILDD